MWRTATVASDICTFFTPNPHQNERKRLYFIHNFIVTATLTSKTTSIIDELLKKEIV